MSVFERLRQHWIETSIPVVDPATPEEIATFENRHGVALPADFKAFLCIAGGMQEGFTDEEMLAFASLQALNDPSRWTSPDQARRELIFADFLINSHWYVVGLDAEPHVGPVFATHDGDEYTQVAATFRDFIEAYLTNPEGVACFWTADVPAK